MLEIWLAGVHVLGTAAAYGQAAEAEDIDGISFGDTQNIGADPFAGLCLRSLKQAQGSPDAQRLIVRSRDHDLLTVRLLPWPAPITWAIRPRGR